MRSPPRELELKFALTGKELERLAVALPAMGLAQGEVVTQRLRSIYFDTPDCRLGGHGFSLRLRQIGTAWRQTVKAGTGITGGVSHPVEQEVDLAAPVADVAAFPDKDMRAKLTKLLGKTSPVPVFETVVERTSRPLRTADGSEVELALDRGKVKAGRKTRAICEAEIELKSGSPQSLLEITDRLFSDALPPPSQQSKSELGYRLLLGRMDARHQPLKAEAVAIGNNDTCAHAFAQICRSATHQILHNWQVVLESDDLEGPHQMRIGIRRLRTALDIFAPLAGDPFITDLDDSIRDLGRLVGTLRDADVLYAHIVAPLDDDSKAPLSLRPLLVKLAERREATREVVRAKLAHRTLTKLQLKFALLPAIAAELESEECRKPVLAYSRKALKKCWSRVAKRGRRLEKLDEEERHKLRIDLKALRYAIEFFSPLYPKKKVSRFLARLEDLQDLFGYLNDVISARQLHQLEGPIGGQNPASQRAIGYILGFHTARAEGTWQAARSTWKKLRTSRRFWT